jgi:hypothetical protein
MTIAVVAEAQVVLLTAAVQVMTKAAVAQAAQAMTTVAQAAQAMTIAAVVAAQAAQAMTRAVPRVMTITATSRPSIFVFSTRRSHSLRRVRNSVRSNYHILRCITTYWRPNLYA